MLARIQQFIALGMLAAAVLWTWLTWGWPLAVTLLGLMVLCTGHAAFLGLEFLVVARVNRSDPAPRASTAQMLRAWLNESLTAPRVFLWRQPFRWHAVADSVGAAMDAGGDRDGAVVGSGAGAANAGAAGQRGIVFIHGFFCNRGFWNPWFAPLAQRGQPFCAVNLAPVFGSIEAYVPIVEDAVQRMTQATGMAPVLVCHSMGGLAARAWLRACQGDARVHRVITLGSPHQGTWAGHLSVSANGDQMRLSSPWLQQLARDEPAQRRQLFVCYYSNCDNIVFPASVATLEGADNRLVPGLPHVGMAFDPQVMREVLALAAPHQAPPLTGA